MYELIKAAGNSYYIESPAKIGVYLTGSDEAVLIDSGSDKDAGRRVRKILDGNGWRLKAILNTHSNADISAATAIFRDRQDAGSSPLALNAASLAIHSSNHRFSMGAILQRISGISSFWQRKAMQSHWKTVSFPKVLR